MKNENLLLLSFDVEEFDTPLEYGKKLDLERQFEVSLAGLKNVLEVLEKHQATATFFTTANFTNRYPELLKEMSSKYEVASHGFYHSSFEVKDLLDSRLAIEKVIGQKVHGYRMARMMPVDDDEIKNAGYVYNASLHPTFIPGRYNNLDKPRTWFMKSEVLQIPAAVTPRLRFPLFWLSFKNFPLSVIKSASRSVMKKDGYVNLYFHPWEFTDTTDKDTFGLPFYVSDKGRKMLSKLDRYMSWAKQKDFRFATYYELYKRITDQ